MSEVHICWSLIVAFLSGFAVATGIAFRFSCDAIDDFTAERKHSADLQDKLTDCRRDLEDWMRAYDEVVTRRQPHDHY